VRRDKKWVFILRTWVALGILLGFASLPLVVVTGIEAGEVSQSQASSALAESGAAMISAYQAVSNASAAGANVSALLVRLNEAGDLLTRAHAAYARGDFDSALELANLCHERLVGFVTDANMLMEIAVRDRYSDFLVNVVGSILGSVGVVCGGFFVWFYLDRKYSKNGSQSQ
jgi:hypothetical protein